MGSLPPEKMGPLRKEITLNPGDALFLKAGTVHQVETISPFSLHLSVDLADRNLYPEALLEMLLTQYNRASAASCAPSEAVVAKFMEHAASSEFRQRLSDAQREQLLNCRQFRRLLSSNVVRVFDKWLQNEKGAA